MFSGLKKFVCFCFIVVVSLKTQFLKRTLHAKNFESSDSGSGTGNQDGTNKQLFAKTHVASGEKAGTSPHH